MLSPGAHASSVLRVSDACTQDAAIYRDQIIRRSRVSPPRGDSLPRIVSQGGWQPQPFTKLWLILETVHLNRKSSL
jgi:hypothetical protein